jgi:hypothetical protein
MEKKLWFLMILILVVLGTVLVIRKPAVGKITYKTGEVVLPTPMEYIRYDTPPLSFAYENKYELRPAENNWELVGNSGVMSHYSIMLGTTALASIEDVPGVLMRRIKNEEYVEEKIKWQDIEGVLFRRKDSFELVAAFLIKGKALTVAMTSNSNDEKVLRAEFDKLIESIRWKE